MTSLSQRVCPCSPYVRVTEGCVLVQNLEYRQLLIQSIHATAIKFSEVAANVVHVLMDFLGDSNNTAAVDVIAFVREVVERFPDIRSSIVERLLAAFGDIKSGKVFRGALWIVGEYGTSTKGEAGAFCVFFVRRNL